MAKFETVAQGYQYLCESGEQVTIEDWGYHEKADWVVYSNLRGYIKGGFETAEAAIKEGEKYLKDFLGVKDDD